MSICAYSVKEILPTTIIYIIYIIIHGLTYTHSIMGDFLKDIIT